MRFLLLLVILPTLTLACACQADLSWSAVEGAACYRVSCQRDNFLTTNTTFTLRGLPIGESQIVVTALDINGKPLAVAIQTYTRNKGETEHGKVAFALK